MSDWYDEDTLREMVPELEAENHALRGALQHLYDATSNLDVLMPLQEALRLVATRDRVAALLTQREDAP